MTTAGPRQVIGRLGNVAGHRDRTRHPAESRPGAPGFLAATMPGLGGLLSSEIVEHPDMDPDDKPGFDGRADIVRFQPRRGARWGKP